MPQETPADQPTDAVAAPPGRWLAIETAGLYGSIAAAMVGPAGCDDVVTEPLPQGARSARTLAPAIDGLLGRLGWRPTELAAVAVAIGPGSFTGLRVGVTTAKTLAWATGAAILKVDTLDALAERADPPGNDAGDLWAVVDAQRGELFAAGFAADEGRWRRETDTRRLDRDALVNQLRPADRVVGPLAEALGGVAIQPSADAVLHVAWRRWLAGAADSVLTLAPQYHRASAAEEKLTNK